MVMTRLTFISHAATHAQRLAAFPLDEALDEKQIAEIAALGWNAPKAQQVWSGPERRAQQTAQALGLSPATAVELRDCDYGEWSGRTLSDIELENSEGIVAWLTDPSEAPHGGESIVNLIGRVGRWLDDRGDSGHSIVVTHPAVIRSAIVHALRAPAQAFWRIDIAPLSLTDLRFNGKHWTLRSAACALYKS
jgi:broad specificity phosphatase PhoE